MEAAGAIDDPVRREILVLLRREGPLTAGDIASRFEISRPAVSRHLRVLRESGLVVDEARGRERVYRLDARPLAELDAWLAPFRPAWQARLEHGLDALEIEVRRTTRDRRRSRQHDSDSDSGDQEKTA